jgi:O-antigen ligase
LQLLSEAGIVGFVIYISWILNSVYISYITCKNAVRMNVDVKDKKIIFFSLAFQIFFILYGVTGNPLYESMMFIPYFTAGGITLFYYRSLGTKTKKIYGENEWVEKKNW